MIELIAVGFVAGIVVGISPCILPVLPMILVAGATAPASARPWWRPRARAVAVVVGLVVSFSFLVLAGSEVLSLLHLPEDLLRDAGIALLVLIGLGFLFAPLEELLERPFARIGWAHPSGRTSGLLLGLALGVLFVPCAGPVLAAITVVGATHRVGLTAVILTIAFAAGAAVPLLFVALAGSELAQRVTTLRQHARPVRQVGGVVLIAMALAIGLNSFVGLQRDIPSYTSALQSSVEGSSYVRQQLSELTGNEHASLSTCNANSTRLVNCGKAPAFKGITAWLNTAGGKPLTLAALRGKVVLVDFWTYSCINCERALPHVEAWYRTYARFGFVAVGVHTPEFSFEHVVSNVRAESAQLRVHYPVAIDNDYATWDAYDNEYWPADYLIDAEGNVRHVHFGEGDYTDTEHLIRQLLTDAHPHLTLPPPNHTPNRTPVGEISPETYVGYERVQYLLPSTNVIPNAPEHYQFPVSLALGGFGLSGTWTDRSQEATAGADARLELRFLARDVYLVLGGAGSLEVSVDGSNRTVVVSGVPRLYTLFQARVLTSATLTLDASPGLEVYDFTFG
jgi:cytochrome c biogenesis protein CcdA/thiol-disulfide isomerase/thioredoxin